MIKLEDIWPQILLYDSQWSAEWVERNRRNVARNVRIALFLLVPAYILHIYLDHLGKLEPFSFIIRYRLTTSAFLALSLLMTFSKNFENSMRPTLLGLFVGIALTTNQAVFMQWYPNAPFYFIMIMIVATIYVCKLNPFQTVLYYSLMSFQMRSMTINSIISQGQIAETESLIVVAGIVILTIQMRSVEDIKSFIKDKNEMFLKQKLLNAEIDNSRNISSLLPRRLNDRLNYLRCVLGYSTDIAMDAVFRERERDDIACFFSDIRGYTRSTKKVGTEKNREIKRVLKESTDIVQASWGVPKPAGDLIMAYFDEFDDRANVLNALAAATRMNSYTLERKKVNPENAVTRFCLLSYGSATVGNMGGEDSAREITIIGPLYNVLARIDALTKDEKFIKAVEGSKIIMTREFKVAADRIVPQLKLTEIDLWKIDLKIKDFEEEQFVYCLQVTEENEKVVLGSVVPESNQIIASGSAYLEKMYRGLF